jgi:uncharacterized protein
MTTPAPAVSPPSPLSPTDRTRLRRERQRAAEDREALYDVLREAMFCHLGVVLDGAPLVLPTAFGFDLSPDAPDAPDGTLYLHGSIAARSLAAAREQTVCVTVTLADGLVLARSGFHHSVNYRSAVIYGRPRLVDDPDEKLHALDLIIDHMVPGRSAAVRPPTRKELAATGVVAISLAEASVKRRSGGVKEDEDDLGLPIWAGVIPLRTVAGAAQSSVDCDVPVPGHVTDRVGALTE